MKKCRNCEHKLNNKEIFEGIEESYCCNKCGYEGYTEKGLRELI